MCGRFTLTLSADEIKEIYEVEEIPEGWNPSFNIAPSQNILTSTLESPQKLDFMKWGLNKTFGVKHNPSIIINIRKETLAEKRTFGNIFGNQRCIIPFDGFFEWKKAGKGTKKSIPYYFKIINGKGYALAGLWDFNNADHPIFECAVITGQANELVGQVHERMPIILDQNAQEMWLSKQPANKLLELLQPFPANNMASFPVSPLVNSPGNNSINCISPISLEQTRFNF